MHASYSINIVPRRHIMKHKGYDSTERAFRNKRQLHQHHFPWDPQAHQSGLKWTRWKIRQPTKCIRIGCKYQWSCTVEVWEWISNFIPHVTVYRGLHLSNCIFYTWWTCFQSFHGNRCSRLWILEARSQSNAKMTLQSCEMVDIAFFAFGFSHLISLFCILTYTF